MMDTSSSTTTATADMTGAHHSPSAAIKLEIKEESNCGGSPVPHQTPHKPPTTAAVTSPPQDDSGAPHCKRRRSNDGQASPSIDAASAAAVAASAAAATTTAPVPAAAEHSVPASRKKNSLRNQLANQIVSSSTKPMKKPLYVVRPGSLSTSASTAAAASAAAAAASAVPNTAHYALDATCMLAVFRHLPPETLVTCSMVCKQWSTLSTDPQLWRRMNCAHHKLCASLLTAIVRRQPEHLVLDWTTLAKRQLAWVIGRLPALKHLSLQGTPLSAVLGLHTCLCPPLQILDLSFVRGLNDAAVRDILSPPKDSRPGLADSKSRLRQLKQLKLAGTDISDVALRYVTQGVPSLVHLDLSSCQRITDAGVAQIGTCSSAINTLIELDLSSCKLVTELCLEHLSRCEALTWLDLRHVPQVSTQAVIKFAARSKHNLQVRDVKLVDRRRVVVGGSAAVPVP